MMLGNLSLGLATLPMLVALSNLGLIRRPGLAQLPLEISVLIPARNEATNIGEAVACVLASAGCTIELLVLDDDSTDATPEILAAIDDPRLRVLHAPGLPSGWSGKQHACAVLAREARHPLMVFLDADVRLAPDALSRMGGYMQVHPALGLASGFPRQVTRSWSEWLLLPLIHLLLLGYRPQALDRDPRIAGFAAGCGQLFIARREAYQRVGGHARIRASMHDGLTLPRAFRNAGFGTGLFDATRLASCRMYARFQEVWDGLGKNATEGMATRRALPIWTILLGGGHVLPFVLLIESPASLVVWAACALSLGLRGLLAFRYRQDVRSVLASPFGVTMLLVLQWNALVRAARGRTATWRGRAYPMQ
ncbi:glycosyltransferase [Lichenicoccus roseus]|uniref:Glycosyltransferase n=2 Tax=Lichenicoccus roseus TaxID=2683649 RepID=A0A5R9J7P4_9PROT|nr:glycosyltransferase [Lichenicoccus roseus]